MIIKKILLFTYILLSVLLSSYANCTEPVNSSAKELDIGKVIIGLSFCLAVLAVVVFFLKKQSSHDSQERLLRIKYRLNLNQRSAAYIIDVKGQDFLVIVGGDTVQLERLWPDSSNASNLNSEVIDFNSKVA
jgi:flagellar biogenesis protein FliO